MMTLSDASSRHALAMGVFANIQRLHHQATGSRHPNSWSDSTVTVTPTVTRKRRHRYVSLVQSKAHLPSPSRSKYRTGKVVAKVPQNGPMDDLPRPLAGESAWTEVGSPILCDFAKRKRTSRHTHILPHLLSSSYKSYQFSSSNAGLRKNLGPLSNLLGIGLESMYSSK